MNYKTLISIDQCILIKSALVNLKNYDYIIAGGGCAGLSLAYYLNQSTLADRRILIIDRSEKKDNDRTWCFWTEEETAFQDIIHQEWSALTFAAESGRYRTDLRKGRYQMIRGIDFYQWIRRHLDARPNIHRLRADIQSIGADESGPVLRAGNKNYRAKWIFDSTFAPGELRRKTAGHHFLWQHFHGWIIETPEATFKPEDATLMDFRTPQRGSARFFYLLPLDERRALVEYTIFSPDLLKQEEYEAELGAYCREKLGLVKYDILEREQNKIPMTDAPIIPNKGRQIIPIGAPGGAVKPSTGYAFLRIQRQVKAIVSQLEQGQAPRHPALPRGRFHFYDRLLLHILQHHGEESKRIFTRLFRHNNMRRILTFLDERSHIGQELLIFSRLPFGPFLRALWILYVQPYLPSLRREARYPATISKTSKF